MASAYVLAIDQGTTSSRALVVDDRGAVCGVGQRPFQQHFPKPGWVEHDAAEIWTTTEAAIAEAVDAAGLSEGDIGAVGITNQRETVVLWDRSSGEPVAPAIVWQDRRTAGRCDALRDGGHEALIQERTGLTIDPYFSGTKLAWLLDEAPGTRGRAERGELAAGTIESWLLWKLTGGRRHETDFTNASRTMLFDIHQARWDEDLAGLLGVPLNVLPESLPSRSAFGTTDAAVLGVEAPILAMAGDQQSALFGQGCTGMGQAKNTYGTGCFLLADTGTTAIRSGERLLTSIGAGADGASGDYVLEGSVFVAGALVQWLRDELGLVESSADIEALAATVPDAAGVTIVPAFTGLGAPYWDANARGAILGLTRGTTKAHIARAALDAIALSSAELLRAMESDLGAPVGELRVDGGAAANDLLMQTQADVTGVPVVRPKNLETTAMGVAYLAGIEAGIWASEDEVASLREVDRTFEPRTSADEREQRLAIWRRAVGRVLEREH